MPIVVRLVDRIVFGIAIISTSEIAEFKTELDQYDTATIAALQENQIQLDAVRERMDLLLGQAYVLPDGRRVFKTEDGMRVFDEHGQELSSDAIDSHDIEDARPRWEQYEPELEQFNLLKAERGEILDYQAKLDEARERLDAGDMNRKEFDQLRGDLKAQMPDLVRKQIPDFASNMQPDAAPAQSLAEDLDISGDMVPTSMAAKAFIPG